MTKQTMVSVYSVPEYDPALVEAAIEKIFADQPSAAQLGAGSHVLLKPNLLAKHKPEAAVTTHPEVVRAVIHAVKKRGVLAENIVLADSMGGVYTPAGMASIYNISGLAQVCAQENVECYTGCQWGKRSVSDGKLVTEFSLIDPVLNSDFIIDLAKFKTHVMTGCTAACKNLFGCIPGLQKAEWHMRFPDKEHFGDMLIDLLQTVKPRFAIVDGILALEGDGPAGGTPRQVGLLLAGEDLPDLDLAVCALMGLDPMRVPYLAAANRRGLCATCFDPAHLTGQPEVFMPIEGYRLPDSYRKGSGDTDFASHVPGPLRPAARWVERMIAPHPVVEANKCVGCGKCAEICPRNVIELRQKGTGRKAQIDTGKCIRCFCCHEMCPVKAIAVRQFGLFKL